MRSLLGPRLELVDQRLDLAAVTGDVGIEVRAVRHDHAHTLDLHVGDAQALPRVADLPLDVDRLAVALAELAVDNGHAVGTLRDAHDGERLAAVLAEPR